MKLRYCKEKLLKITLFEEQSYSFSYSSFNVIFDQDKFFFGERYVKQGPPVGE